MQGGSFMSSKNVKVNKLEKLHKNSKVNKAEMSSKNGEINEMVEKFQCPGCVNGSSVCDCKKYSIAIEQFHFFYENHCPGTRILGVRSSLILLGLPKGFNRIGDDHKDNDEYVRLFVNKNGLIYDKFNVPVWALEKDGYLFIRTFAPRLNRTFVDIHKGMKISMVPNAIDVSKFYDEMD